MDAVVGIGTAFIDSITNIFNKVSDGFDFVLSGIENFKDFFTGIDFSVLYSWLPSDIATVCGAIIVFLLVLAVFGIIKKVTFFFG